MKTVCTCMEVLKKELEDDDAISMLVVGTESGSVLILDPSGTSVLKAFQLPAAPLYMNVSGVKDIEYRIVCACRDGNVHSSRERTQWSRHRARIDAVRPRAAR